jgi:hypothetical protein
MITVKTTKLAWAAMGWLATFYGVLGSAEELPPPAQPLPEKMEIAPGPFQPTWKSLKQWKCPRLVS